MLLLKILFFISLIGILHTYLFYPLFMLGWSKISPKQNKEALKTKNKPTVEIIFAAYNEESVIQEKIISSFKSIYPAEKLSVRIGTDNCTDSTNSIIRDLQKEYPSLHLKAFSERTGKSGIINQLVQESKADYLILTDANIIFNEETISELVESLKPEKVGIVGGNIIYKDVDSNGISAQEDSYLKLENGIKQAESQLFKAVMGVEGGCYSIKRELFPTIPPLFFMEDFYVTLSVIEKRYQVLFNSDALCFEDVSTHKKEEYKRKIRISIGNFQNLNRFKGLIIKRFFPVGFAFLSHKVLRWLTPFFLISMLLTSVIMGFSMPLFMWIAILYSAFLFAGALGILFSQRKSASWIKYPGHFIYMNLALLKGFFIYLKGVKTNVWQPTSRNQK